MEILVRAQRIRAPRNAGRGSSERRLASTLALVSAHLARRCNEICDDVDRGGY